MDKLHVLSHSAEPFYDRIEAGRLLGHALKNLRLQKALVLGIPRGGLVVAREVARMLDGELDIVLSRKLRATYNPELAIGAVTETGRLFLDETLVSHLGVPADYIEQEKEQQMAEIDRRMQLVRSVRPKASLTGRLVIVTDDGVATGATMQAALWAARQENPQKLVCALPVGPEETIMRLAQACDEMVVLRLPAYFSAVGQFYAQFDQVEDDAVLDILKAEALRRQGGEK